MPSASQAEGYGFESRCPLQSFQRVVSNTLTALFFFSGALLTCRINIQENQSERTLSASTEFQHKNDIVLTSAFLVTILFHNRR